MRDLEKEIEVLTAERDSLAASEAELREVIKREVKLHCSDTDPMQCGRCRVLYGALFRHPPSRPSEVVAWQREVVEAAKAIKAERRKTIQTGTFNSAEMLDAVDKMDQLLSSEPQEPVTPKEER